MLVASECRPARGRRWTWIVEASPPGALRAAKQQAHARVDMPTCDDMYGVRSGSRVRTAEDFWRDLDRKFSPPDSISRIGKRVREEAEGRADMIMNALGLALGRRRCRRRCYGLARGLWRSTCCGRTVHRPVGLRAPTPVTATAGDVLMSRCALRHQTRERRKEGAKHIKT